VSPGIGDCTNAIDRYNVGDRAQGMRRNSDGSLRISAARRRRGRPRVDGHSAHPEAARIDGGHHGDAQRHPGRNGRRLQRLVRAASRRASPAPAWADAAVVVRRRAMPRQTWCGRATALSQPRSASANPRLSTVPAGREGRLRPARRTGQPPDSSALATKLPSTPVAPRTRTVGSRCLVMWPTVRRTWIIGQSQVRGVKTGQLPVAEMGTRQEINARRPAHASCPVMPYNDVR
jgi:hypothetical protein